jgi:hypothetical protein
MSPLLLLAGLALAHDPVVSTVDLRELEGGWIVQLSLATAGANRALRAEEAGFDAFDEARWKAALVDHVREGLVVTADDAPVPLGAGGVRAGPHQTDLVFELPTLDRPDALVVTARVLDLPGQTQVVRVHPRGGTARRAVVTAAEGYRAAWPADFRATVGERDPAARVHAPQHHDHDHDHDHVSHPSVGLAALGLGLLGGLALLARRERASRARLAVPDAGTR